MPVAEGLDALNSGSGPLRGIACNGMGRIGSASSTSAGGGTGGMSRSGGDTSKRDAWITLAFGARLPCAPNIGSHRSNKAKISVLVVFNVQSTTGRLKAAGSDYETGILGDCLIAMQNDWEVKITNGTGVWALTATLSTTCPVGPETKFSGKTRVHELRGTSPEQGGI